MFQKIDEITYLDPDTGEVIDRQAYLKSQGVDTTFGVTDEQSLNWYLRKRHTKVKEIETVEALLKAQLKSLKSDLASFDFLYKAGAQAVTEEMAAAAGKRQIITQWGKLKLTTTQGGWVVADEDALQAAIAVMTPEQKKKYGVMPVIFTRNLQAIYADIDAGELVAPSGLNHKEPGTRFNIAYAKED